MWEDHWLERALPVGAMIGGYTVVRIMYYNEYSIVYEACNSKTGRRVAIKELFPNGIASRINQSQLAYQDGHTRFFDWALQKFQETATTLCMLNHPNIARVDDYWLANNTIYMVMEMLDGLTLQDWLDARASLPSVEELRPLVEPVMDALVYLHEKGLVHQDIAPDNILVACGDRPVLTGFGLLSQTIWQAMLKEKPILVDLFAQHYRAPEQWRSSAPPTPAMDVYSMGAVLYRSLSGAPPADGLWRMDEFFYGRPDPYQPLAALKDCPAHVAAAVDMALAMRPEERLRDMAELRAAVTTPAVAPSPQVTRRWRWPWR